MKAAHFHYLELDMLRPMGNHKNRFPWPAFKKTERRIADELRL